LRVLLVTGAYFPEFSAGGLQSRAIAARLRDHVTFSVLTTATDATLPRHATVDGIEVARVHVRVGSRSSAMLASLAMVSELLRALPRVDAVHVQGYSSKNIVLMAMCRLFRRPVVMHLQTSKHDEPATVRAQGRLAWWAYSSATAYFSVSPGLSARYLEAGLSPRRLREIPNAVDASRFSPASPAQRRSLRERLQLPVDRPVVLFVGVMSNDKQPHVLFDAWLQMRRSGGPAAVLVFVGASDPALYELGDRISDRLRAAAAASGLDGDVYFMPPTQAVEDYFHAADVFAMPSLREGLPIVLLEAMACGLPVVASHLPGATDAIVEPGVNGVLVSPGDVAGFARGLGRLLAQPDEATQLGAAARQTVAARYTIERVAERWLDAYQQLLASR